MLDIITSSTIPPTPIVPQTGKKAKGAPKPPRPRLQTELLEKREVPAVLVGGDAPAPLEEGASEVLQASQMSAFFQQSALFAVGQPTSSPTVSWSPRYLNEQTVTVHPTVQTTTAFPVITPIKGEARPGVATVFTPPGPSSRASTGKAERTFEDEQWPSQVYAPYVEINEGPLVDLAEIARTQGIRYFNLSFIGADSQNRPAWNGQDNLAVDGGAFDLALRRRIRDLRALGGDVAVSFGGPHAKELAQAITNVDDLTSAYREVIHAYRLKRLDFKLDATALADHDANARRDEAIARLQDEFASQGHQLEVWFTLPASPTGLSTEALDMLRAAGQKGVDVGGVNIMPANYPDQSSTDARHKMGLYSIQAAISVFDQLHTVLPDAAKLDMWEKVGLTPTVGPVASGEQFTHDDAQQVRDFARQEAMGMVSLWSLNRDSHAATPAGSTSHQTGTAAESQAADFSEILRTFIGAGN